MSLNELAAGMFYFDYAADKIYLAQDPEGHVVETTQTTGAFAGNARDVTVSGLEVEKFASTTGTAGIATKGSGWVVRDNEVRLNSGAGISGSAYSIVIGNYVHHNGRIGINGAGSNLLIEDNEVSYNDTSDFAGWAAGGSKWHNSTQVTIRGNYFHHNMGHGIWVDIDSKGILIEDNLSEDNRGHGIDMEISYNGVIRNNRSLNNGLNGIFISESPNVNVYGNVVAGNRRGGVYLWQKPRGTGPWGPRELRDVSIHDNVISMTADSRTGLRISPQMSQTYFSGHNLSFYSNDYQLPSEAQRYFLWKGSTLTLAEWKAAGQS